MLPWLGSGCGEVAVRSAPIGLKERVGVEIGAFDGVGAGVKSAGDLVEAEAPVTGGAVPKSLDTGTLVQVEQQGMQVCGGTACAGTSHHSLNANCGCVFEKLRAPAAKAL